MLCLVAMVTKVRVYDIVKTIGKTFRAKSRMNNG